MIPSSDYDVLVIGAGISGINAAYRLQTELPHYRFAVLEARDSIGGTWDLFRYPGIRSDSDLYTFGFAWYPWNQPTPIAEGSAILSYLEDAAKAHNLKQYIHLNHRVQSAQWDGSHWSLQVESENETQELVSRFVIFATGYYDYHRPLEAQIPGLDNFQGQVIHPQFWPGDFDPQGKKIVVIGSGATAVTLVPSLAEDAQSVTMLQRSPTYLASVPNASATTFWSRILPRAVMYYVRRFRHLVVGHMFYRFCHRFPNVARSMLVKGMREQLPPSVPSDPHFKPSYNPWEQRLCACPDGDFFRALRSSKASVETDTIAQVEADGIQLVKGNKLPADVIVTATGLKLQFAGGIPITVNGKKLVVGEKYMWNGLMLQDLPNASLVLGFTNASWTLGADIAMRLTCRMLKHMDGKGYSVAVPAMEGSKEKLQPKLALDLSSTYISRAVKEMPKAAAARPWVSRTSFFDDSRFAYMGDITRGIHFE